MSIKNKLPEVIASPEQAATIPAALAAKSVEAAAPQVAKLVDASGNSIGTTSSTLQEGAAKMAAGFSETQAKVKQNMDNAMKTAEEMVTFGQGNIEAMMKSSQIWVSGFQDLSRQMAASAQASFEQTVSTFKQLSGVKSLKDAVDLQTNLARSTMEKTLAESGRLTDASFKLAEQALAPITARVTLAVEKFSKTV